jgi:hypothetical protein
MSDVDLRTEERERHVALIARCIRRAILWAPAVNLAVDLWNFHGLSRLCRQWVPNDAGYCDAYMTKCLAVPADCHGFLDYLPPLQFNFHQIVAPDFGRASVLGYIWWGLQNLAGFAWDFILFGWYVIRQPLLLNPLLWFVSALVIIRLAQGFGSPINAMLSFVENQKALGDAAPARSGPTHIALLGQGDGVVREFED